MADSRYRMFYVYMENRLDSRDDEVWKVRAKTKDMAKSLAQNDHRAYRFSIRSVFTWKGLRRYDPYWHQLLWGTPPMIDGARFKCV